jgi:hypothetical protein
MRQCLSVLAFVANSTTNHASHLPNPLRYRKGEYVFDFTAHFLCSDCQNLSMTSLDPLHVPTDSLRRIKHDLLNSYEEMRP